MSQDIYAVVYGVLLDRETVFNLFEKISESEEDIEEMLGFVPSFNNEHCYDLSCSDFNSFLKELSEFQEDVTTLYNAYGDDDPAFIGTFLGYIDEGDLLGQVKHFEEQLKNNLPYEDNILAKFLPDPKLIVIRHND